VARPSLRFSNNALSALVGAAAFAVLTTGTAVAVATSAVSITDASTGAKTHVTGKQSLVTSERDPFNGVYSRVDGNGGQLVSDGVPAQVWTGRKQITLLQNTFSDTADITAPSTGRLGVRTLSARVAVTSGQHVQATLMYTERNGQQMSLYVPLVMQGDFSSEDVVVTTMNVDIYPKAGSTISLHVYRSAAANNAKISFNLLGQLT
jgi:hypothetical protein